MARPIDNAPTEIHCLRRSRPEAGGVFVPLLLMIAGLTTIGACVLVPLWRQCCELELEKQQLQRQLRHTASRLHDVQRQIAALQTEPAFCEQIAITYLGYSRAGQRYFTTPAVTEKQKPQTPPSMPPAGPLMRVLTHRTQRAALLAGAIALLATGLVLLSTDRERPDNL